MSNTESAPPATWHLALSRLNSPHSQTYVWPSIRYILILALGVFVVAACSAPSTAVLVRETAAEANHTNLENRAPTLADYWAGRAEFRMEIADTGLPMGESETLKRTPERTLSQPSGSLSGESPPTIQSYVHAGYSALGVLDQCGEPVEFPGCVVIYESADAGKAFAPIPLEGFPVDAVRCRIPCRSCPCTSSRDHIDQQQYPRVKRHIVRDSDGTPQAESWLMAYEYRARVFLRRSTNGLDWSPPEELPLAGIWETWYMRCPHHAAIKSHPFSSPIYDCLVGSPPGLYFDERDASENPALGAPEVYVFVGLGQNPGAMGCYRGPLHAPASLYRLCEHNPLFVGAPEYGPLDETGPAANPHFDFRTISSAEVIQVDAEYYMLYEGVRGPEAGAAGDTQFALALARTTDGRIDGPWETFPGNPILVDNPGNVGLGHADLLMLNGVTYLYTTLDGEKRSRLVLEWTE